MKSSSSSLQNDIQKTFQWAILQFAVVAAVLFIGGLSFFLFFTVKSGFDRGILAVKPALLNDYYRGDYRSILPTLEMTELFEPESIIVCSFDSHLLVASPGIAKTLNDDSLCNVHGGLTDSKLSLDDNEMVLHIYGRPKMHWLNILELATFVLFATLLFLTLLVRRVQRSVFTKFKITLDSIPKILSAAFTGASTSETLPSELQALAEKITTFVNENRKLQSEINADEVSAAEVHLAKQVAHDIRSPLAALDLALRDLDSLSEDTRVLVRSATQRIRDIANNLLTKPIVESESAMEDGNTLSVHLVSGIIDSILSEKRIQSRSKPGILIDFAIKNNSYGHFAKINVREFKRIISNLINNSVEAIGERGNIEVTLVDSDDSAVCIIIQDSGRGIPANILPEIGKRGFSTNKMSKQSGSGLGLYHARSTIESWAGELTLTSEVGVGTKIKIILPRAPSPKWFVDKLRIQPSDTVVVLDDDISIHQVWDRRFQSVSENIKVIHFSSPEEFKLWKQNERADLYLIDFELLGFESTGIDVIRGLNLEKKSVLVTSRYEEIQLQSRCENFGIGLIPKSLASIVPVVVTNPPDVD